MRILQIHNYYSVPGGECSVVRAEKTLLEAHGHTVSQFTRASADIAKMTLPERAASLIRIPGNARSARELAVVVEREKPDVAHVHNVFPLLSPSVYSTLRQQGIPVVQTLHNFRFLCPNGLFFTRGNICEQCQERGFFAAVRNRCLRGSLTVSLLYATAIRFAWRSGNLPNNIDRYIALNQFVAAKLVKGGVPQDRIRICGNFVERFAESPSSKKGYVLYLGRLSHEKGIMTLLTAMERLPHMRLVIAGTGPLEADLRAHARNHPNLNITFAGFMVGPEKDRLIREALALVVPSEWYENFPVSVVESLAQGTPVVASRIGGLPEMVTHGETGLLFTPGNVEELARCLATLVDDPTATTRMASTALASAIDRFSPDAHYRQLLDIYRDAATAR